MSLEYAEGVTFPLNSTTSPLVNSTPLLDRYVVLPIMSLSTLIKEFDSMSAIKNRPNASGVINP